MELVPPLPKQASSLILHSEDGKQMLVIERYTDGEVILGVMSTGSQEVYAASTISLSKPQADSLAAWLGTWGAGG